MRTSSYLRRAAWLVAAWLLAVPAPGCKKKPASVPVAVKGRVEHADGKPLSGVVLVLHPHGESNRGNIHSAAVTDGRFEARCLPGRYKAALAPLRAAAHGTPASGPLADPGQEPRAFALPGIPRAYLDNKISPWDVTIPEAGQDDLVLTVE